MLPRSHGTHPKDRRATAGMWQVMRSKPIATALLASFALAACSGGTDTGDVIRIGLAGPLDASYGVSVREGAELAVQQINDAGGIDGRPLELVVKDDGADPERAIEVATSFVDDPTISAVVGHVNSGTTRDAARIYNRADGGLLELSPTATSADVSTAGEWTFRVCATDLSHGPALADWAYGDLARRRALVLYANDAYGRGILQSFEAAFRKHGGDVVSADPYLSDMVDSAAVLRPYLQRGLRGRADLIVVGGEMDVALPALRLARAMGFDGPMVGGDGLLGMEEEAPGAGGVYISTGFLADQPGEKSRAFVGAFRERYGTAPSGDAALAYDAVNLLARGLASAGSDRRALRDWMAGVGSETPAFDGVTGRIAFDENGDPVSKEVVIGTIRDGRLVSAAAAAN